MIECHLHDQITKDSALSSHLLSFSSERASHCKELRVATASEEPGHSVTSSQEIKWVGLEADLSPSEPSDETATPADIYIASYEKP